MLSYRITNGDTSVRKTTLNACAAATRRSRASRRRSTIRSTNRARLVLCMGASFAKPVGIIAYKYLKLQMSMPTRIPPMTARFRSGSIQDMYKKLAGPLLVGLIAVPVFGFALIVVPLSLSAMVTCRDTDKGCTLEQLTQLNNDADALGLAKEDRIAILQEMIQKLTALLAGLQSSSSGTTSSCLDLTQNLYIGKTDTTTNGEVSKLQNFLLDSGYGDRDGDSGFLLQKATGYYGAQTASAVVKWQKAHGMDFVTAKSGVGPMTRAKMKCGSVSMPEILRIAWRIETANASVTDENDYRKYEQAIFLDVVRADSSIRGYNVGKAYGCAASNDLPSMPGKKVLGFVNCYFALTGTSFIAYEANGKFTVERGDESAKDGGVKKTVVLEI